MPLLRPLPAPDMRPDPDELALVLAEVEELLTAMEMSSYCEPALCFRPVEGGGYEMYGVRSVIPGTVSLRTGGGMWRRRKK